MDFPLYQAPYAGNGMIIGLNAVVHVFISHGIAIGAFAMLALADYAAAGSTETAETWDRFLRRFLKFTTVTVSVAGAVTGAGIWFTTNALAPRGIASMLRLFFWPWFLEWIVFVLEVIVLLVYYFQWNASRRRRARLAGFYLFLAFCSAFLITGIISFMLTAGAWPAGRRFAEAFFNPSFVPQLATRLLFALAIGALLAIAFALPFRSDARFASEALRLFGIVLLFILPLLGIALLAYLNAVPPGFLTWTKFSVLTSHLSQHAWILVGANLAGAALTAAVGLAAFRGRVRRTAGLLPAALVFSFLFVTEFERVREFIRGPYLMPGYMFANTMLLSELPYLAGHGALPTSYWYGKARSGDSAYAAGAYLFGVNCSACHTIGGINDIRERAAGRSEDGLYVILTHTHDTASFMPPFAGSERESRILARFLYQLASDKVRMRSHSRLVPEEASK